jgi:hypothetical protein
MKLEVGMYCYNKVNRKLGIGKIKRFGINNNVLIIYKNNIELVSKGNVIASYDIMDILKIGDFVNGCKVHNIANCLTIILDNEENISWINPSDIKSIVTKEQFEYMEYRIGE